MRSKTQAAIQNFSNLRVLVIGEAMLDMYLRGSANRICREAPVPIVDIKSSIPQPGGAANTALNLHDLGAQVEFLSVIGDDHNGYILREALSRRGINTSGLLMSEQRETMTKHRVSAGDHLLVRFDSGSGEPLEHEDEKRLIGRLAARFHKVDAIVVSDYGYGILTDRVIRSIQKLQDKKESLLVIDAKALDKYAASRPTAVKPNYQELTTLLSITSPAPAGKRAQQLEPLGTKLLRATGARYVAATIDTEGALVFRKDGKPYRTYSNPAEHIQAVGAGDSYVSGLTLGLAAGLKVETAAELAQAAAKIVVQKKGTATCLQNELIQYFGAGSKSVAGLDDLQERIEQWRRVGQRIVFTNGCFDILHSGHVEYLRKAKALGDVLVLGINADASIRRLKGPKRPINTLEDRSRVLDGLDSVDLIVPFEDDTPEELIKIVKPDFFAKGGDYTLATLPEAPLVQALGGTVHIIPFRDGRSTSKIITKIEQLAIDS